jgi:hypothetical protein
MAFPISPSNNAQATVNGIVYVYSTATSAWTRLAQTILPSTTGSSLVSGTYTFALSTSGIVTLNGTVFSSGSGGGTFNGGSVTSSTQFNNATASTDTASGAVTVIGGVGIGGNLNVGGTVTGGGVRTTTTSTNPSNPTVGDIWYNTTNDIMYRYTYDGNNYYWIDVNGPNTGNGFFGIVPGTDIAVDSGIIVSNNSTLQSVTGRGATATVAISITNAAQTTSTTTGALTVTGGVGIGGNLYVGGITILQEVQETMVPVISPGASAALNFSRGAIFYITGMTSNFTAAFTNVPTDANSVYATSLILAQGGTAYVVNAVSINGVTNTLRWSGGAAATAAANRTGVVGITIMATGTNAYIVLASGSEYY